MQIADTAGSLTRVATAADRLIAGSTFLGGTPRQWLQAAIAAAAGVAVLWVLRAITVHRLAKLAAKTDTVADDFAIELVRGIRTSLFVFVALVGIDAFITFPPPADEAVRIIKTDRQRTVKIFAQRMRLDDRELLNDTYNYFAPRFSFPPRVDMQGIKDTLDFYAETSPELRGRRPEEFIDQSVLDELEREGFFKSLGS